MALQRFACGITVMIILVCKGSYSQPACLRPPINSRIFGGQGVSPGSWPWHVTFHSNGWLFCHGSLITDEWVLTAAQCSRQNYLSGAVVHLGATNQSAYGNVTRRIDSIHCHQDFSYNTYDNDICLVKLSAPVNFTDYIRPVCLASENSTFYDGTDSWVTGVDSYYYYYYPSTLQEANISVIGTNKCSCSYNNSYFNYYYNRVITNNMLCAGSENGSKSSSYGDYGAALVTKQDSIWVQSGIVSFVYGYYLGLPTIYTRVSQYQEWISDRVTGMEPGFVTFTSPGIDSDLDFTCPLPSTTTTTTTHYTYTFSSPTTHTTTPYTKTVSPPKPTRTTIPQTTDDSIFGSGETLIPITHFFSLSVLALLFHLFVGSSGI